jgi:hypothetical protein
MLKIVDNSRRGLAQLLAASVGLAAWACSGDAAAARVSQISPQGEVAEVRQVTVRFDSAVVPAGDPRAAAPFTLQCNGRTPPADARWLDDRNWVLDLRQPLAAGQRCTLQAAPGFTPLGGPITGTASRPQIAFSSVPALPEDEILSRILFGESVTNLSAPEALQLAAALNSLRGGGGGFNPLGMVRSGLGIDRLRILPADTATGRGTSIAAGQYIGRNVYVELATDAQGYTATRIEVSLTRSLSILSEVATLGGTSASIRWKRDY